MSSAEPQQSAIPLTDRASGVVFRSPPVRSRERQYRGHVEYTVSHGRMVGTLKLPDQPERQFASADELERHLNIAAGQLLLIERQHESAPAIAPDRALSHTERAIARAALAGQTNRQIAASHCYSVKSVEAYLTRIYRRLGIDGRAQLEQFRDELPPAAGP